MSYFNSFCFRLSQWCRIIENSFTKELMYVFVSLCVEQEKTPSLELFFDWIPQIKNRSLVFLMKIIWCYLYPIETFRRGASKNNHHYMNSAEKWVDMLFFSDNHTTYQKIVIHRDLRRLSMKSSLLNRLELPLGSGKTHDTSNRIFKFYYLELK